MFSSRTGWNLAPNELSRLLEEKRRANESIIDLTESNPTRCGFSYGRKILQSLSEEQSLHYDPEPRGLLSARESIGAYYKRRHVRVIPENITLTASTSEAYTYLFRLLCNPGENVLVPKPSYPLFEYLCDLNDVEAVFYRLQYNDEWRIDFESLESAVDQSTRAVLLVHPNNPTGSFIRNDERKRIIEFVQRNRLVLIVDEVFGEYSLKEEEGQYESFASVENVPTFTLNGISKMLGLPQLKLAWITVSGNAQSVREATTRLEIVSDTYLSVGTPVQRALPELLEDGEGVAEQIRKRIRVNHRVLTSLAARLPVSLYSAEGGWSAILRLPSFKSDETWALDILREQNVLVYPGHFFEMDQASSIVVSLLPPETIFAEAIAKILNAVEKVAETRSS